MDTSYSFSYKTKNNSVIEEWMLCPHNAYQLPDNNVLVRSKLSAAKIVLTTDVYHAFNLCSSFAPLSNHVSNISSNIPALSKHADNVKSVLAQVADQGLMISKTQLLNKLSANAQDHAEKIVINTLFIRTCDRPDSLKRLLASIEKANLAKTIQLVDNSRQANNCALNEQHLQQSQLEHIYFGPEQQRAYIAALTAQLPEHEEAINFLLNVESHPDNTTPGLPLNIILLLSAGQPFLLMDDDILLDARKNPEANDGTIAISQDGRKGHPLDPKKSWDTFAVQDIKTGISQLEQFTGMCLHTLLSESQTDTQIQLEDTSPMMLEHLQPTSRILLATCGTLGDPGTGSNGWIFDQNIESLKKLPKDKTEYAQRLKDRNVWMGAEKINLQSDYALMTTTITCINNSEIIPPTTPAHRNEDYFLGILIKLLHPDSLKAEVPWSVPHLPQPARTWEKKSTDQAEQVGFIQFIADYLSRSTQSIHATKASKRLSLTASLLTDLANTSDQQLTEQIIDYVSYNRAQIARNHAQTLKQVKGYNHLLDADLQTSIQVNTQALAEPGDWHFPDLATESTQQQIDTLKPWLLKLAVGLSAWQDIRDTAIKLNQK